MENKLVQNYENFEIIKNNNIGVKDLSFRYFNSEEYIFENINLNYQKIHILC